MVNVCMNVNPLNVGSPDRKTSTDVSVPQFPAGAPGEQLSTLWNPPVLVQRTVSPEFRVTSCGLKKLLPTVTSMIASAGAVSANVRSPSSPPAT